MTTEYDYQYTIPGPPRPQLRHRSRYIKGTKGRKGFVHMYDDPTSVADKKRIRDFMWGKEVKPLLDCPLRVDLVFHMPRPLAHYGTGRNSHILKPEAPKLHRRKPDIDNLRKLLMDALTGIVWRDDSIVCLGTTEKCYADVPRTEVFIKVLKETEQENLLWEKEKEKQASSLP